MSYQVCIKITANDRQLDLRSSATRRYYYNTNFSPRSQRYFSTNFTDFLLIYDMDSISSGIAGFLLKNHIESPLEVPSQLLNVLLQIPPPSLPP